MKIDYNSIFCKYLAGTSICSYQKIPVDTDLFILGSEDFKKIIPKWVEYLDGNHENHPNAYIDYKHGYCRFTKNGILDVFTEINIMDRFHGVCKKLLEKDFEYCFNCFSYGERPYIIVTQDWFDRIISDYYSTYAMIDIIGIKNYINTYGTIKKEIIVNYKNAIDKVASHEADYTFITFTDNIFIKADWISILPEYKNTYDPEHFLYVIKEIQDAIYKVFHLKSYSIVTQGIQLFDYDESLKNRLIDNHFFIGSIATPFIELFDIENSIKNRIKVDPSFKKSLYLSEAFLLSLKFKSYNINKEKIGFLSTFMENNSGVCMDSFRAVDIEEVIELF
jgi:hypothetical protein